MSGYEILSLEEIQPVVYRGSNLLAVRHALGYRAAGMNAWSADAGGQLVPPHEEDSGNEELYVVVRGRATFTIGDETAEGPAGTLVFVPPETHRTAVADEDGTIVLAIGATVGQPFHGGAWDTFAVADAHRRAGRIEEGRSVLHASIAEDPSSWARVYNAACWESLAGNADEAFELLRRAFTMNEAEVRDYMAHDGDLDPIRRDPRFQELLA